MSLEGSNKKRLRHTEIILKLLAILYGPRSQAAQGLLVLQQSGPTHLFIQEFEFIVLWNYRISEESEDKSGWELPVYFCLILSSPGERRMQMWPTCKLFWSVSARLSHAKQHSRFWDNELSFWQLSMWTVRRQWEILEGRSGRRSGLEIWF